MTDKTCTNAQPEQTPALASLHALLLDIGADLLDLQSQTAADMQELRELMLTLKKEAEATYRPRKQ